MRQSATIVIDRPPVDVFDYVMEISNDAQWRTGIAEAAYTSNGPLGVGTTGFDRISVNRRDMIAAWTTVEYVPGRLARWTFDSGPLQGFGGYVCEPAGSYTSFTLEAEVKPTGAYRWLGPAYDVLVRRLNRADVRKLKSILETP